MRLGGRGTLIVGVLLALLLARLAAPMIIGDALISAGLRSPKILSLPFLGDIAADRLGDRITAPAGSDTALITVVIDPGSSTASIATQLKGAGLIADETGFIVAVSRAGLDGLLQAGRFRVAASMTPVQIAQALSTPYHEPAIAVELRPGLRMEQIVAKLTTIDLPFAAKDVYEILRNPSASILTDYPWLDLPDGATLEGRLGSGVINVPISTDADGFVRMLLDRFVVQVPAELRGQAPDGRSFDDVLTLASIVEREAAVDDERPRMAGVYTYRLQLGQGLYADPSIIWVADSAALRKLPIDRWSTYEFWTFPEKPYSGLIPPRVPKDLAAWNTFVRRGLPPSPLCSPTRASIEAALAPDTSRKELYFVLIPNSGGRHDFSQTLAEHNAKARKYGWQ